MTKTEIGTKNELGNSKIKPKKRVEKSGVAKREIEILIK